MRCTKRSNSFFFERRLRLMHPLIFYTMDKDVGTARWRAIRGVYDRRGVHFDSAGVRPGCPIQHPPIRAKITPPKRRPAAPPGPSTSPIPLIFPHFQNEGILEVKPHHDHGQRPKASEGAKPRRTPA